MSGSLSSIFGGNPVPPQPQGSDTSTSYPLWLQQYDYNLADAATNLAGQDYTPYPGQQVATPSAATQQSWQMAQNNIGNYQPDLSTAQGLTNQATGIAQNNTGYQAPLSQALALSQQSSAPIGQNQINQYMSPYTQDVVGALQQAANTNLFQNQLPGIQSQFVSAGQAASPQQMQAYNNALYQSNQALDQATAGALQSGYSTALGEANTEQQAGLTGAGQQGQLATTMQQLGASNANQLAGLGAQYGALGQTTQQLGAFDVGQEAASGQSQDAVNQANINASINNFQAQQQWPYQNLAYASNIIRGQNVPSNTTAVGQTFQNSGYTSAPLSSFVGGALGAYALGNSGSSSGTTTGAAKGGHIRRHPANDDGALARHFRRAA